TGDFDSDVLPCHPHALGAIGAVAVITERLDLWIVQIQRERTVAGIAGTTRAEVFRVDAQLSLANRAGNVITGRPDLHEAVEFRQGGKDRNLDAVLFQVGIQQGPTGPAVNEVFGHLLAAFGTWSTGPCWHMSSNRSNEE